mmetsp:Transcript_12489/g.29825  ORF Transcript_12489/g.29825 Transcript_12489/m.29825 type:complete len:202 (-) Transcript_12489:948-1553(-)
MADALSALLRRSLKATFSSALFCTLLRSREPFACRAMLRYWARVGFLPNLGMREGSSRSPSRPSVENLAISCSVGSRVRSGSLVDGRCSSSLDNGTSFVAILRMAAATISLRFNTRGPLAAFDAFVSLCAFLSASRFSMLCWPSSLPRFLPVAAILSSVLMSLFMASPPILLSSSSSVRSCTSRSTTGCSVMLLPSPFMAK